MLFYLCTKLTDMRLSELKTGEKGVIIKVLGHGGFRKRIVEMGFIKGKTVEEALKMTNKAVCEALDGLPPVKVHCSCLAEEAVHAALWDYAKKNNLEFEGLKEPVADIHEHDHGEEEEE